MMPILLAIVVVLLAGLVVYVGRQWNPTIPEGDRTPHPQWVDQHDYG
jgi:hypothetical protein